MASETQQLDLPLVGVRIQASVDAKTGARTPTFKMVAYDGGVMKLVGLGRVVVDVKGMELPSVLPIHRDHDISRVVGHGSPKRHNGRVVVQGVISAGNAHADEVVLAAKNGFPWQASIGADVLDAEQVIAGQKKTINGRSLTGPFLYAKAVRLREVSFVSLGASDGTSASIAAKRSLAKGIGDMATFSEWLEARKIKVEDLDSEQIEALERDFMVIEKSRALEGSASARTKAEPNTPEETANVATITAAGGHDIELERELHRTQLRSIEHYDRLAWIDEHLKGHPAIAAQALREDWSEARIQLESKKANRPKGPAIHTSQGIESLDSETLACALVRACGVPGSRKHAVTGEVWGYQHWFPEQVVEASDTPDLRDISLHYITDLPLRQLYGGNVFPNHRSLGYVDQVRDAMFKIRAAGGISTLDVTNVFKSASNKLLWAGYDGVPTTWQEIAGIHRVQDYKDHTIHRVIHTGGFTPLGADGEIKHGSWDEQEYTTRTEIFAKMVAMTVKDIVNDDLSAFSNMLTELGQRAAESQEEIVYVKLLTDRDTVIFTAGNKNKVAANPVLGIAGLDVGVNTMATQVTAEGMPIRIGPMRLLTGTNQSVLAGQLFRDAEIRPTGTATDRILISNPFQGQFAPVASAYLNNTSIKQTVRSVGSALINQTALQWMLFADPNSSRGSTLVVPLLNGERRPRLEQDDREFTVLGMQWRAWQSFECTLGDPKFAVMSTGAGS